MRACDCVYKMRAEGPNSAETLGADVKKIYQETRKTAEMIVAHALHKGTLDSILRGCGLTSPPAATLN